MRTRIVPRPRPLAGPARGRGDVSRARASRGGPSSARNGSTEAGTTEISATPTACPSPCSRWRSSRLMPASPTSVSRRASDPGSSGTTTETTSYAAGAAPCLPGIRAWPRLPASRTRLRVPSEPSPSASTRASRAPTTSSTWSRTWRRTSRTAGALPARIWVHSRGSLAAIRVTSRSPCPARPTADSGSSRRHAATMLAASWGTCETAATASSCSWAGMTRTAEPTASRELRCTLADRRVGRGLVRHDDPGAAVEEVASGGRGARALPTGHRVRADVAARVGARSRARRAAPTP